LCFRDFCLCDLSDIDALSIDIGFRPPGETSNRGKQQRAAGGIANVAICRRLTDPRPLPMVFSGAKSAALP
jgi:hypothetical protein